MHAKPDLHVYFEATITLRARWSQPLFRLPKCLSSPSFFIGFAITLLNMPESKSLIQRYRPIVLFGILFSVLFMLICPAIEDTRLEARIGIAYNSIRVIAASHSGTTPALLEEKDPWGEPYRIVRSTEGPCVMSNGPNRTSHQSWFDHDDIHSSMPESPMRPIHRRKQFQLLLALSLPLIWLIGSIAYITMSKRNSTSR